MAEAIYFEYRGNEEFKPQHRWGKGWLVDDASTYRGAAPEVQVDRPALTERARMRHAQDIARVAVDQASKDKNED